MTTNSMKKYSTTYIWYALYKLLTVKRRVHVFFAWALMVISAAFEVISIASLLPVISAITSENSIKNYPFIYNPLEQLSQLSSLNVITVAIIAYVFLLYAATGVRLLNLWSTHKLTAAIGTDISYKSYKTILCRDYTSHVNSNSGESIASLTSEVSQVVSIVRATIYMFSALATSSAILITLLLVNLKLAVISIGILSLSYLFISVSSRKALSEHSQNLAFSTRNQVKIVQQGIGSIRDISLSKTYRYYLNDYLKNDVSMRSSISKSAFLTSYPRYLLETIAISVIFLTLLLLKGSGQPIITLIPVIGVFALASQKLLPSLQQIYTCWASMSLSKRSGLNIIELLLRSKYSQNLLLDYSSKENLSFNKIAFNNVCYSYDKDPVLTEFSLEICKGEKIGIIGETGSGKSTFLDLFMGLIKPDSGNIQIDNCDLNSSKKFLNSWQLLISHVPQNIYLSDKSILENIAFTIKPETINKSRAINASKIANIYEYIQSLPNNFSTSTGEHGVKLSGGQRQRLGIARAIYKCTPILILDEATSALDEATEKEVMNNINQISPSPTVLIIAHRLSTLKYCDKIVDIKHGKIKNIYSRESSFFLNKIQPKST